MLNQILKETKANFIFSTWHSNDYRKNEYIERLWSDYRIITKDHYYHVGGKENNRNPMLEALITNLKQPTAGAIGYNGSSAVKSGRVDRRGKIYEERLSDVL